MLLASTMMGRFPSTAQRYLTHENMHTPCFRIVLVTAHARSFYNYCTTLKQLFFRRNEIKRTVLWGSLSGSLFGLWNHDWILEIIIIIIQSGPLPPSLSHRLPPHTRFFTTTRWASSCVVESSEQKKVLMHLRCLYVSFSTRFFLSTHTQDVSKILHRRRKFGWIAGWSFVNLKFFTTL